MLFSHGVAGLWRGQGSDSTVLESVAGFRASFSHLSLIGGGQCHSFAGHVMWALIVGLLVAAWYFGVWPFDETERAIENSSYNVYLYFPDGKESYLGEVETLSGCRSFANAGANSAGMAPWSGWTYICCRITSSSGCESKHR